MWITLGNHIVRVRDIIRVEKTKINDGEEVVRVFVMRPDTILILFEINEEEARPFFDYIKGWMPDGEE